MRPSFRAAEKGVRRGGGGNERESVVERIAHSQLRVSTTIQLGSQTGRNWSKQSIKTCK